MVAAGCAAIAAFTLVAGPPEGVREVVDGTPFAPSRDLFTATDLADALAEMHDVLEADASGVAEVNIHRDHLSALVVPADAGHDYDRYSYVFGAVESDVEAIDWPDSLVKAAPFSLDSVEPVVVERLAQDVLAESGLTHPEVTHLIVRGDEAGEVTFSVYVDGRVQSARVVADSSGDVVEVYR
ncbi:hypothetical protein GCM10023339_46600 [Alloalcanivorax gelatiniphagus]